MAKHFDFIDRLQARTALLAVGRSTLRNQGAPGVVRVARKYLRSMDLSDFCVTSWGAFAAVLEVHTHRPLRENYRLSRLEPWLELPLDSYAYDGLVADSPKDKTIPSWPGVKGLK